MYHIRKENTTHAVANYVYTFHRAMLTDCLFVVYSGTSDKEPSEIRMTSLQRTLVSTPC